MQFNTVMPQKTYTEPLLHQGGWEHDGPQICFKILEPNLGIQMEIRCTKLSAMVTLCFRPLFSILNHPNTTA